MTIGEIIERAGLDTVLGMAIVFLMLSIISFVIFLFRFAAGSPSEKDGNEGIKPRTWESAKKNKENMDDDIDQIIAVTAAATAAYDADHPNGDQYSYVVRSARRRN